MKKLFAAMALAGAAMLASTGTQELLAQKGKSGTVELIESKDGKFRFTVRDSDGKYVGGSAVGYKTEKDAKEAVDDLKKALASPAFVSKKSEEPKKDKDKK